MKRWYVIQTKSGKEQAVCQLLDQTGIDMYLPKVEHYIHHHRLNYFKSASLFPSYCFCHIDFSIAQNYNMIRYTRGVNRILGNNCPVPVGDEIIQILKQRIGKGDLSKVIPFQKGDYLRVKRGLLKDLIGIIEKPIDANGRIAVLIKLVNYEMKVSAHWSEVEKVAIS